MHCFIKNSCNTGFYTFSFFPNINFSSNIIRKGVIMVARIEVAFQEGQNDAVAQDV